MQYLDVGLFPVNAPSHLTIVWTGKLGPSLWPQLVEQRESGRLRQLAERYGVSHETVRRALKAASVRRLML